MTYSGRSHSQGRHTAKIPKPLTNILKLLGGILNKPRLWQFFFRQENFSKPPASACFPGLFENSAEPDLPIAAPVEAGWDFGCDPPKSLGMQKSSSG